MTEEITIDAGHLRFAARASGPADGLPVLALHGWLDNAASFDPLVAHLPEGVRLVALDMAGHGLSEWRPAGVPYHLTDFVLDAAAVADALGWQRFSLLSHSLGASISALLAGAWPERVKSLVLIEGLGPWSADAGSGPARLRESIDHHLRRDGSGSPHYASLELAAAARQRAGDLQPDAALQLARRGTRQENGGFFWRSDPRLRYRSPIYFAEEQVKAFLAAIRAPTLLIRGESGLVSRHADWETRAAIVPEMQVRVLPGGHHLHMDHPEAVARVSGGFLRDRR